MAAEIEEHRPDAYIELVGEEDRLGMFDVVADGRHLWSKYQQGGFPEPAAIISMLPEAPTS